MSGGSIPPVGTRTQKVDQGADGCHRKEHQLVKKASDIRPIFNFNYGIKTSKTMKEPDINRLRAKLAVAKDIAEDFRANTSLDTIIREYEERIKELEKQYNND
jgi:hypothetical protein